MSVSFLPYVLDEATATWRTPAEAVGRFLSEIPPAFGSADYDRWYNDELDCTNPRYDRRLDVNLSERNGGLVLTELGFLTLGQNFYDAPPVPITIFEAGVEATLARNPVPMDGIPAHHEANYFDPGVRDGYVNTQLARLLVLVAAAREYGATHIGWG